MPKFNLFGTLAKMKDVQSREALAVNNLKDSIFDDENNEYIMSITDIVAFTKNPDKRSSESEKDCTLGLTILIQDLDGKTVSKKKASSTISQGLWEALGNGRDLIKVPYRNKDDYKRSDIKGSPKNMLVLEKIGVQLFTFDAYISDDGQYPTHTVEVNGEEVEEEIFENFVMGTKDEFTVNAEQVRPKDKNEAE